MAKTKVLLVHGGQSSEHDVSLMSARNVYAALDNSRYDVTLCLIDRDGKWWLQDTIDDSHIGRPQLLPVLGQKKFVTLPDHHIIQPDVIFPVLHGKNGEDGTVQGLFELMGLPYVGCNVEASALCMDKSATKKLSGVTVVDSIEFHAHDNYRTYIQEQIDSLGSPHSQGYNDITERLGDGPWFVKPNRSGSSVGVTKVATLDTLADAIDVALEHDSTVLVERAITGRELEVAVLGNPPHHRMSGVGEIIVGAEFYDYNDKYDPNSTSRTVFDADLPETLKEIIRRRAGEAYQNLGCTGLARVDFLLGDDLVPYMNEVNTLPGFTNISMYPKLWRQAGTSYPDLVTKLIDLALE